MTMHSQKRVKQSYDVTFNYFHREKTLIDEKTIFSNDNPTHSLRNVRCLHVTNDIQTTSCKRHVANDMLQTTCCKRHVTNDILQTIYKRHLANDIQTTCYKWHVAGDLIFLTWVISIRFLSEMLIRPLPNFNAVGKQWFMFVSSSSTCSRPIHVTCSDVISNIGITS